MGKKRQDIDGWNSRYSKDRFRGEQGAQGANISPQEAQVVVTIADPGGTYDSAETIPAGAIITGIEGHITEAFNNVPTLILGSTGTTDLVINLVDAVDLTTTGYFYKSLWTHTNEVAWPAASVARATIGGAPNQGAGTIKVFYTV